MEIPPGEGFCFILRIYGPFIQLANFGHIKSGLLLYDEIEQTACYLLRKT
ncbi:hypothetical protein [Paenibacillus puldeungensis]